MAAAVHGQVKIFKEGKNLRIELDDAAAELIQDNAKNFVQGADPREPIFRLVPAIDNKGKSKSLHQHHIIPYPELGKALSSLAKAVEREQWKMIATDYLNDPNNILAQAYFILQVTAQNADELRLPFVTDKLDMIGYGFSGAVLYNPNNLIIGPSADKRAHDPKSGYEYEPQKLLGYDVNTLKKQVEENKTKGMNILDLLKVKRAKIVKWTSTTKGYVMEHPEGPFHHNENLAQSRSAGKVYNIDTGVVAPP